MEIMPASVGRSKLVVLVSVVAAAMATTMYLLQSVKLESQQDRIKSALMLAKGFEHPATAVSEPAAVEKTEANVGHEPVVGTALAKDGSYQDRLLDYSPEDQKAFKHEYKFTKDFFLPAVPVWSLALAKHKDQPNVQYLEVGAFQGMSVCWMLENILTGPGAQVTAIDPFQAFDGVENSKQVYEHNIEQTGKQEQVKTIEGYSQTELRKLPEAHFDIIYIDGSHRAPDVLEDAVLALRLLKPGGLMIFDDYAWELNSPEIDRPDGAINTFYQFYRDQLEVVHKGYQVIFRKHTQGEEVTALQRQEPNATGLLGCRI